MSPCYIPILGISESYLQNPSLGAIVQLALIFLGVLLTSLVSANLLFHCRLAIAKIAQS